MRESERYPSGIPFDFEGDSGARLMAGVKWRKLTPPPPSEDDGTPYATHSGTMIVPGLGPLVVYQLNTGQRLIAADSVSDYLTGRLPCPPSS